MIPDEVKNFPVAAALLNTAPDAVLGAKFDRGELTLEIAAEHIGAVCAYLKQSQDFVRLSTVTGVDWYPAEPRFEVIYHLHSPERNERLRLKCRLAGENPEIDSVTAVWSGAGWDEREEFDLFGIRFRNHTHYRRHMLP